MSTKENVVSITPLLKRLWPSPGAAEVTASEIALAISQIFTDSLTPVQTGALLTALHFTGWDRRADVIASCAKVMREAAAQVDPLVLEEVVKTQGRREGDYRGGLCDIVGTGGDDHSTFNISTTSSIIASALLLISKHGNRASTSKSGSADILGFTKPIAPVIAAVKPKTLGKVYQETNYAFLFAPVFHPGMRYVAPIRKELGWRTIFNLLGPLSNPVEGPLLESRVIGVARRDLGPVFADALRISGAQKALVVCGEEDLDELSCAGRTFCWMLKSKAAEAPTAHEEASQSQVDIDAFTLEPADFGFPRHPLYEVSGGKLPDENAEILMSILNGNMEDDAPLMHFVLINTAALLVASGICEADTSSMGENDDGKVITERGPGNGRWKEGVRRARWAIKSGKAALMFQKFAQVTNNLSSEEIAR